MSSYGIIVVIGSPRFADVLVVICQDWPVFIIMDPRSSLSSLRAFGPSSGSSLAFRARNTKSIDKKLFAVIGHSSREFVEGLCCMLTQCEESEVPNALIDILVVRDIIKDLEQEASKVGNAVLTRVQEVRVSLQDIIAWVRIDMDALDEAYEKGEIYHQYADSINLVNPSQSAQSSYCVLPCIILKKPNLQQIKKDADVTMKTLGYDEDETGTISEPETGEDENDALTDLPSCLLALKSIKDKMLVLIQEPCTFTEGLLFRSSDSLPCQHWPGHIPLFSNVEQDYGNLFGIFLANTGTGLFPMSSKTGNFFDSVHMPPATVPFFIECVFTLSPLQQCIFINSAPSTERPELTVIRQNHPSFESVARSMADESVLHVYKSVFYNIPAQVKPSQSIFYVTHGTHIGVIAGWENALNCVMGVPGAAYFEVDSIAIGEEKIRAAIDEGCVEMVEPWVTSDY
ncbi:hypothetical protein BDR06DRAFT_1010590 [Suillus hirtellus]|nr:hypothetical protein BDR06DRAFT_1010590 [Suillus hirtellus]